MDERPATLWDRIKKMWDDEARHRCLATDLHTAEWRERAGHIPDDELEERFPYAEQNR